MALQPDIILTLPVGEAAPYTAMGLLVEELAPGRLTAIVSIGDGSYGGPVDGLVGRTLPNEQNGSSEHPSLASIAEAAKRLWVRWRRSRLPVRESEATAT